MATSQSRISLPRTLCESPQVPLASSLPLGLNATVSTVRGSWGSEAMKDLRFTSHSRTSQKSLPKPLPLARSLPSGLMANDHTMARWPFKVAARAGEVRVDGRVAALLPAVGVARPAVGVARPPVPCSGLRVNKNAVVGMAAVVAANPPSRTLRRRRPLGVGSWANGGAEGTNAASL